MQNNPGETTHGMRRTRIYGVWCNIKQRCNNPSNPDYHYYGGRGITLCKRWEEFENFYKDMGDVFGDLTVERIDNDKGYSKDNCIWATRAEQSKNKRKYSNNKTGYTGVDLRLTGRHAGKYRARVGQKQIGQFNTAEEAHEARQDYLEWGG